MNSRELLHSVSQLNYYIHYTNYKLGGSSRSVSKCNIYKCMQSCRCDGDLCHTKSYR